MTFPRKNEWLFSLSMFFHFFSIIAIFWILKTLKKGTFIAFYDAQNFELFNHVFSPAQTEIFAKGFNVLNSIVVMLVISICSGIFKQKKFFLVMNSIMILFLATTALAFNPHSELSVWNLYLLGDLYVMTMVPCFLSFLNDSVSSSTAKRLYGFICLGGVVGGAFGSSSVRGFIDKLQITDWLFVCIGISIVLTLLSLTTKTLDCEKDIIAVKGERMNDQTSALRGVKKVFSSSYLTGIMLLVFLYEIVSATIDFQFTSLTSMTLSGSELKGHFASVYTMINWVAVCVQFVLTPVLLTKAGIRTTLLILPALLAIGSSAFLCFPFLMIASLLPIVDNGLNYSLNQSAREVLYTIAPSRYSAKAFIDVFVNRFAKIVALVLIMGVSLIFVEADSLRWLSLFALFILSIWMFVASYLGKQFEEKR
ncbi:hypothetical protein GW915_10640 [bacterium]|nr:hypothetical protein [bacterium]